MRYWCFVNWEPVELEKVLTGKIPLALQAADNGNYKPLKELYRNGIDVINPVYKSGGWAFSLREYCNRYWVKTRYNGILECFAPNKSGIYKALGRYNVLECMEVENRLEAV